MFSSVLTATDAYPTVPVAVIIRTVDAEFEYT